MAVQFENDFQHKLMNQSFSQPFTLTSADDVLAWRSQWTQALSSWHSPYKCLVDCSNLSIQADPAVKEALDLMQRFLEGFFLKKAAGFHKNPDQGHDLLPFPVFPTLEEAEQAIGVRAPKQPKDTSDLRSAIQIENHFNQHVVELSFHRPVSLQSKTDLIILKSKLSNNLMQWHSPWSLLIDCSNLELSEELNDEWKKLEGFFRGFFLKSVIGYGPNTKVQPFPFATYRARHKATANLEAEGAFSGAEADCQSRKTSP